MLNLRRSLWMLAVVSLSVSCSDPTKEDPGETGQLGSNLVWDTPVMVKDFRAETSSASTEFGDFIKLGNTAFFVAGTPDSGSELWRTDGTAAGTTLVRDLCPGECSSYPSNLTVLGSQVFFFANHAGGRRGLWKSDGTEAGTVLVSEMKTSLDRSLVAAGNRVFFPVSDPQLGTELWSSDGTVAGTGPVADLCAGSCGSNPVMMAESKGRLYFIARESSASGLYLTDGTAAGTLLLKAFTPAPTYSGWTYSSAGTVYFAMDTAGELWKTDGTVAGTVLVTDVSPELPTVYLSPLATVSGTLLFSASSNGVGALWSTDGTAAGTKPLLSLIQARDFTAFNGAVYFSAALPNDILQIWKTDGTAQGTQAVTHVPKQGPFGDSWSPQRLMVHGNRLFFIATSWDTGWELWSTDGTESGTALFAELAPARAGSNPFPRMSLNGVLLFSANDQSAGNELWTTDGTKAGTHLLADLSQSGSNPSNLIAVGNQLFFSMANETNRFRFATSDGTANGTVMLEGIAGFNMRFDYAALGSTLIFSAAGTSGSDGYELFKSDGTAAGTGLVKDASPEFQGSQPEGFTTFNGSVFYAATTAANGKELWRTDGTEAGSVLFKDLYPGKESSSPRGFIVWNNLLYFFAESQFGGIAELWATDGTEPGTVRIARVAERDRYASPYYLTPFNGRLFFTASNAASGIQLWSTDGTAAGTQMVKAIEDGALLRKYATPLFPFDGKLFFAGSDASGGMELWSSDGTAAGTQRVSDLLPGAEGSAPTNFTVSGNWLYFTADDGTHGRELWRTDGNSVQMVADILPGVLGGLNGPRTATLLPLSDVGRLLFAASDETHGSELWQVNDAGVVSRVADLSPGRKSSNPSGFVRVGNTVYFSADDGTHGKELWKLSFTTP